VRLEEYTVKPTVIDLFSGAGLFSHAFIKQGFQVIRAIEIDPIATATYRNNIGNHIQCADVTTVGPAGKSDVIIAGPPCQGFSTLGKRDIMDPRNFLGLEVAKWAAKCRPSVVVIENVAAFLDAPAYTILTSRLSKMGYTIQSMVLNAFDFGVPQIRKRSFTIATKRGTPNVRPVIRRHLKTVRQALKGLPPEPNGYNHHWAPEPSPLALSRMCIIPPGGDKRDVMRLAPELAANSWWSVRSAVTDVWGRMSWHAPCNTLRTALLNPSKGRYIHPEQNRVLSLREACRLHSIEDSWYFEGKPTHIARQIGNSVPPLLGRAVAQAIWELF
jgi:DNA (cytosine-5)-methyltransferase 1